MATGRFFLSCSESISKASSRLCILNARSYRTGFSLANGICFLSLLIDVIKASSLIETRTMSDMANLRIDAKWLGLKALFDIAALVSELKSVVGGIGLLSIGQRLSRESKARRDYPLHGVVRRQIIDPPCVPNHSP